MKHYAGLDVSVKETSICIVNRPDEGRGRCKGSRAWDPRKDFSLFMPQPTTLSTSSDEAGRICREMKVVSYPEDLLAVLCDPAWRLERVGLEAGPLSQWLFSGLAEAGVPSISSKRDTRRRFSRRRSTKAIATTRAGSRR